MIGCVSRMSWQYACISGTEVVVVVVVVVVVSVVCLPVVHGPEHTLTLTQCTVLHKSEKTKTTKKVKRKWNEWNGGRLKRQWSVIVTEKGRRWYVYLHKSKNIPGIFPLVPSFVPCPS